MKKIFSILLSLLLITFSNLEVKAAKPVPQKSMFQIREVQTYSFETSDTMQVIKAVINTLQDNGFIIQRVEPELGYISAKKEVKLKRTNKGRVAVYSSCLALNAAAFGLSFGLNPSAAYGMYQNSMQMKNEIAPHTVIFDSNVNIEGLGKRTKVRFCVIEKVLENGDGYTTVKSSPRKVVRHYEPEIYQEFFSQVNKNIFFEKNI